LRIQSDGAQLLPGAASQSPANRPLFRGTTPAVPASVKSPVGGLTNNKTVTTNKQTKQETTMKKWNTRLMTATLAVAWILGAGSLMAQNAPGGGRPGGDRQGGPGGGRGNFDPAEFQQRMMDRYKEQLEVTDDGEWKALQPLVQKVMDARMASFSGRGGMFGRGGRPGGDNNQGDRPRTGFGAANVEAEALQKAIDAKASSAELKAAMTKFVEARKAKQAELEAAQAKLRAVLSVRQEAIATSSGLL
jgi:hypothetical protein